MPLSFSMAQRFTLLETLDETASSYLLRVLDAKTGTEVRLRRWKKAAEGLDAVEKTLLIVQETAHPHTGEIVETGSDDAGYFVLLRPAWGEPLTQVLAEGPLRVEEFTPLVDQLVGGLAAVHERGVVHGALRPEVIRVLRQDSGWHARIIGFGLGFESSDPEMLPHYRCAAPEIWDGESLRRRTDVYALGCVLYECLAGRPAFAGRDEKDMRNRHRKHDLLPLDRAAPHVPRWMAAWVMKLMMAAPDKRPANAGIARQLWEQQEAGLVATAEALPQQQTTTATASYGSPPLAHPPPQFAPLQQPQSGATSRAIALPVIPLAHPAHPNTTRTVPIAAQRPVSQVARLPAGTAKPPGPPVKLIAIVAGALIALVGILWLAFGSSSVPGAKAATSSPLPVVRGVVNSNDSKEPRAVVISTAGDLHYRAPTQNPPGPAPAYPSGITPPPALDRLLIHLRADLAPYTYAGNEAETKPARDGDALAELHDFGPLLKDNTFAASPWQPGNRSMRIEPLAPAADFPLRAARRFITFNSSSTPACSLALSARGDGQPFTNGLTLGLVFFAKAKDHDMNIFQASFDALNLSARMNADKTLRIVTSTQAKGQAKNKGKGKASASKPLVLSDVSIAKPTLLLIRWQSAAPRLRVSLVNAAGKSTEARWMKPSSRRHP